jgi:hypothetical protein
MQINPDKPPVLELKTTTETVFRLPKGVVYNLYDSRLNFDIVLDEANNTVVHDEFLAYIYSIELYTNDNVYLAKLDNLPEYTRITWLPNTHIRDNLPLKMLYNSIFAINENLYFNESLILKITWNAGEKFGYVIDNSNNLTTNLNKVPTINNVYLYLAINEGDKSFLKPMVKYEGFDITVPYVHMYKAQAPDRPLTSHTLSYTLNKKHGHNLLRVLIGIYANNQNGARYCDLYNYNANKWVSYKTLLDGKPLQKEVLQVLNNSAYYYNCNKLGGIKLEDWAKVPTIIENFYKTAPCDYGLSLNNEHEFTLQFTTSDRLTDSLNVYMFFVCQKTFTITNDGVEVDKYLL